MDTHIYIALPLLDELDNLDLIFNNLVAQTFKDFTLVVCVNQPNDWWNDDYKRKICNRNALTIEKIKNQATISTINCIIIDKSSNGNGWEDKKHGVGWARKTIMDKISSISNENDIIVSIDGDTYYKPNYLQTIINYFNSHSKIDVISIPYYHPQNSDKQANRAILRYEIYMRYYFLNLVRIKSPYTFSALGSALTFRQRALSKIGGFTPKKSGEDFYFLQKMVKYKPISNWITEKVYPAARFSDRVYFGTGPAMIKGNNGDWSSYPLYPISLFDNIHAFYNLIPKLYIKNIDTPIDSFWNNKNDRNSIFNKLRANNKDLPHFTKAVHDYFDALKTLQYLKSSYTPGNEERNLIEFLNTNFAAGINNNLLNGFSFNNSTLKHLNAIRDFLCKKEDFYRQQIS